MTRADASAVVTMEILVEQEQILPVRIALEKFGSACDGTATVLAADKNVDETSGDLGSHLPEVRFVAGSRRKFDFEVFPIIVVVLLQGFDEEVVQRKPDGSAPVRIAAKKAAGGFRRFVVDATDVIVYLH